MESSKKAKEFFGAADEIHCYLSILKVENYFAKHEAKAKLTGGDE